MKDCGRVHGEACPRQACGVLGDDESLQENIEKNMTGGCPSVGLTTMAEHLKDVAAVGGWRDTSTLLRYQQPDEVTMRKVAEFERSLSNRIRP